MFFSISSSVSCPLGHILRKHPDNARCLETRYGDVQVFTPKNDEEQRVCVTVDARKVQKKDSVSSYVSDEHSVAGFLLAMGLCSVFRTAIASQDTRDMTPTPLVVRVLPVRGPDNMIRDYFESLGWSVSLTSVGGCHYDVTLSAVTTVRRALCQVVVGLCVFDNNRYGYQDNTDVERFIKLSKDWLPSHPKAYALTRRFLRFPALIKKACVQLNIDVPKSLHSERHHDIVDILKRYKASRIIDMGCGEGLLLRRLASDKSFSRVLGVEPSPAYMKRAQGAISEPWKRLALQNRVSITQGSVFTPDAEFQGYDTIVLCEVIEHIAKDAFPLWEPVVFGLLKQDVRRILITTPNRDWNPDTRLRHPDHKFEFSTQEFDDWCDHICETYRVKAQYFMIGPEKDRVKPTHAVMFHRNTD